MKIVRPADIEKMRSVLSAQLLWLDKQIIEVGRKSSRLNAIMALSDRHLTEIDELRREIDACASQIYAFKAQLHSDLNQLDALETEELEQHWVKPLSH